MLEQLKFIDLTHSLSQEMPQWPAPAKVAFSHSIHMSYHESGALITNISSTTGAGTHVDAPKHFIEGARAIDQLTLEELYCPAVVIDIKQQSLQNPDYTLQYQDIKMWIETYGPLPKKALVIANSGWSKYWHEPESYANVGEDQLMHFPGFSREAADFLLEQNVAGIGIDTFSLDCGISESFPVHKTILGADKYQIENMANVDRLPASGAYILTCPMPIKDAPEAFAKVLAVTL